MTGAAFAAMFLLLVAGALAALVLPQPRRWATASVVLAGAAAIGLGIAVGFGTAAPSWRLDTGLPFGPLTIGVDRLAALFLVLIGTVVLATAIYAAGYLAHQPGDRSPRTTLVLFNVLVLSLLLIVSAADVVTFLIAWEAMAFLSYLAVSAGQDDPELAHAGYLMLAISELGTVGIIGALLLLGNAGGGMSFDTLRAGASHLSPLVRDLVFLLALFGCGAKAGLLPLQLWMPGANAAAPGHVAAVLAGAIEGLGIYGMLRVMVDLLGRGPAWWGLVMLGLGASTAFVGILHAFVERDLKRILAYSTIENDGIIIAAIGLGLTFRAYGLAVLAAIAGLFALYHLLNHGVYKALLFLGAGAVDAAAGTRDLEQLGGLIRRMPWTAITFLVGALSIAAVAPFAGYISEWGILESMLQSFAIPSTGAKLVIAGSGALIALTTALAITTFVRVYAVGFLAQPRSAGAEQAHEVAGSMRLGMALLSVVTVGLGVLPAFVITGLDRVTAVLWGTSVLDRVVPPFFTGHPGAYAALVPLGARLFQGLPVNGLVIIAAPGLATITSPTYLALAELLLIGIVWGAVKLVRPLGARRTAPVWAGGIPRFTPRMQYGGVAYSNPARLIFHGLYRSRVEMVPTALAARDGTGEISYRQEVPAPLERELYRPITRALGFVAEWVKVIQSGSVNQYVLYIFAMVVLILVLRAF